MGEVGYFGVICVTGKVHMICPKGTILIFAYGQGLRGAAFFLVCVFHKLDGHLFVLKPLNPHCRN